MRDLDQAIDLYLGELARRGHTQATRDAYQWLLWKFAATYDADYLPWEIAPDHCRRFLDRWRNHSSTTLAGHVSILRGFFDFLYDERIIESNPMERIRRPKRKRPEDVDVVTVSSSDVDKLIAAVERWDEVLCIACLTYLGPRRNAAAQVRRQDVDLERGRIRFREKGGKLITKPIPHELREILAEAERQGVWAKPSDYLIPNRRPPRRKHERSNKVIYAIVKRLAERAGVNVHPHALRAAFAVRYLEQHPGDLDALQELMGHVRTEQTKVYLRRQDKMAAMERVLDLSWNRPRFPSSADMPPTGFEPVSESERLSEPLRRKLDELKAQTKERA